MALGIEVSKPNGVDVASGAGIATRFRTELPNPGDALLNGALSLAGNMEKVGAEDEFRKAEKAGQDQALATPLQKDPATGQYQLPTTPTQFGSIAAKTFDQIAMQRTLQQTYADNQQRLNEIGLQFRNDPAEAQRQMQAHIDGAMKGMDPRIAGQMQPMFTREVAERTRSIATSVQAKDDSANIAGLDQGIKDLRSEISDLASVNTPEAAAKIAGLQGEIGKSLQALKDHHVIDDATFEREGRIQQGLVAAGNIMQIIKEKIANHTLTESDLVDLERVTRGQVADGENVLGFTGEWVRDNLKDRETREALARNLAQTKAAFGQQFSKDVADQRYRAIEDQVDKGAHSFPLGVSAEVKEQVAARSAQEHGVNLMTPDGAQWAFDRYGEVPVRFYKEQFAKAYAADAKQIETQYLPLWNQLNNMKTQDGGRVPITSALDDKDAAFMARVEMFGATPENIELARKGVAAGMTADPATREKMRGELFNMKGEDFRNALAKKVPNGRPWSESWANLPVEAQTMMKEHAVNLRLMGVDADTAMAMAGKHFAEVYTKAPDYMLGSAGPGAGWVRKDMVVRGVPTVTDPKAEDLSYLNRTMTALVDPKGERDVAYTDVNGVVQTRKAGTDGVAATRPDLQLKYMNGATAIDIPKTARLGHDLFLQPDTTKATVDANGNPSTSYKVFYKGGDMAYPTPVVGQNGQVLVITPGKAQRLHEANIRTQIDERHNLETHTPQQAAEQAMLSGSATILPVTAFPEQKDRPVDVNEMLPDPPGGQFRTPGDKPAVGRGARGSTFTGGRVDDAPVRGAITIPSIYAPDKPAAGAGDASSETTPTANGGWVIPGTLKEVQARMGTNTAIATDYFLRRGYSPAQTAGIVGNLFHESGGTMSTGARNRGDAGPGQDSVGIGQWNRERLAGLSDFASAHGLDMRNLGTQLAYVEHELHTSEHSTRERLMGSRDNFAQSTANFAVGYERPRGFQQGFAAVAGASGRLSAARAIFSMIGRQNG
jgi:hypothetical protein